MLRSFVVSAGLHVTALGLLVWFSPPPQPKAGEEPKLVMLEALPPPPMPVAAPHVPQMATEPPAAPPVEAAPTSAAPAAEAAVRPTTPDSGYLGRLHAWLARHKHYPSAASRDRREGVVTLRIIIDRQGRVILREVVKSSGVPALDDAALEMVDRANPLPGLPADFPADRFDMTVPVGYRLR